MADKLTNKEKYLFETFKLDVPLIKKISEIGRLAGTSKYDVWIAKEVKKQPELLNELDGFIHIIDWAKITRPNISSLDYKTCYEMSDIWHQNLQFNTKTKNKESKEGDDRIIFKCQDKKHFFILLDETDLETEGNIMRNCVGTYTGKVKNRSSIIISLRDDKNESHVTIEIDSKTAMCIQVKGKANIEPPPKYLKLIVEFAMFMNGYNTTLDPDIRELIEMKFE